MEKVEGGEGGGRGEKKEGSVVKAASRWHLQRMPLLPKSPLDSSPLGKRCGYFEGSDPKQSVFH